MEEEGPGSEDRPVREGGVSMASAEGSAGAWGQGAGSTSIRKVAEARCSSLSNPGDFGTALGYTRGIRRRRHRGKSLGVSQ